MPSRKRLNRKNKLSAKRKLRREEEQKRRVSERVAELREFVKQKAVYQVTYTTKDLPKIPIEDPHCSVCGIMMYTEGDHKCDIGVCKYQRRAPACLPCRCSPNMCNDCMFQWIEADTVGEGRAGEDDPEDAEEFGCPTCKAACPVKVSVDEEDYICFF